MTTPLNISSDDAAFFQASTPDRDPMSSDNGGDDDSDGAEDPVGRGASKVGQLDMFVAPQPKHHVEKRGSRAVPTTNIQFTPGAHTVPWNRNF